MFGSQNLETLPESSSTGNSILTTVKPDDLRFTFRADQHQNTFHSENTILQTILSSKQEEIRKCKR